MNSVEELQGDDFVFRCLSVAVTTNTWSFRTNLFFLTNVVLKASPLPKVMVWFWGLCHSLLFQHQICVCLLSAGEILFFPLVREADFFLSEMTL